MTTTAGEAIYHCVQDGQEKMAYVYAETALYQANGVANWRMASLLSFLAPKDQANATYRLIFQSTASFTENPQWHLMQAQITAANAAAALRIFRLTLQETQARYEKWSSSMLRQQQNFSDVLNGHTLTVDPSTGQQREVWTGTGSTRWIDGLGNVVSSNLSPGTSFRALQDVGR
jgi:N-acetyl-beta-hexosaminidase